MADVSNDRAVWLARHILPHEAALRSWLVRRRLCDLETDDIVQETYAKLAALTSVQDIRQPKSYMFQTAYSIIAGHLRRSRIVSISAAADLDQLDIPSSDVSAEEDLIFRDELKGLAEALASLPSPCREAFILRRVSGLSQRETAARMAVSEKTIEKYMTKCIRLLMDRFGRGGKATFRTSKLAKLSSIDDDEVIKPGS